MRNKKTNKLGFTTVPNSSKSKKTEKLDAPSRSVDKSTKTGGKKQTTKRRRSTPIGLKSMDKNNNTGENAVVKLIPLGGMREIGKNCYAYSYQDEIILVDTGIAFPDDNMPGVDVIIPDFTWLQDNRDKVKALFLTHGHEDHIGAISWFASEFEVPIYSLPMTLKLVEIKLKDRSRNKRKQTSNANLIQVKSGDTVTVGSFSVEFIHVNHSIADSCALLISTPAGRILHTGDFKVDFTPVHGDPIDLGRLAEIGNEGLLALVSDSTNVEIPGNTASEQMVGISFANIFSDIKGRILVATFASNIDRIQQIITAAEDRNRKVALLGRSMINAFEAATSLGYITCREDTIISADQINNLPPEELVLITTGTQGEEMSALARMAFSEHRLVKINSDDTVILSSSMIPGNEKSIYRVINELYKLGANVIYRSLADVHVSGHAHRDELKLMLNLAKPRYFIPMHGEFRQLFEHAQLAREQKIKAENIFLLSNGDILELSEQYAMVNGYVPAGGTLIDGSGIGDIDQSVLQQRLRLADDGVIALHFVVDEPANRLYCTPQLQASGFVYESDITHIFDLCTERIHKFVDKTHQKNQPLAKMLASDSFKKQLIDFIYSRTGRRPILLISAINISLEGKYEH